MANTSVVDHIIASEKYRCETFSSLLHFPSITRHQLALAGFIYRERECVCLTCGVMIHLTNLDKDKTYDANHFRKLHREKIGNLGKRCAFLLCESGTNIDDLHPSQQQEKLQWYDAEQPDFSDYTTRFQTFDSWPSLQQEENSFVNRSSMARHGFYFSGPEDGVTCFYCGNTLIDWSEKINSTYQNIIQLEHARFFPCRFITYTVGAKFVADASYFHVVSAQERRSRNPITSKPVINSPIPQSTDECLLTFENWPEEASISAKDLAETGFYYLGEQFRVKCYMCNLEVDDWHHGMTALGTHSRRRNTCEIVQAILSTKTSEIQCANEKWRLQTLMGLTFGSDCDENLCRELAACGFYRFKNTRNIRCAYCGVLIKPNMDSSIMAQHRLLAKQSRKATMMDCLMVRAQCAANIIIPDRERFPEYRNYQSIFDRMQSFESYKERFKVSEDFIRERAEAGFFLDTIKHMRCFQCGNSLRIHDKKLQEKYPQYDIAKLHAHFYPTCEWVREILGFKYVAQVLFDRSKSNILEEQRSFNTQSSSSTSSRTTFESVSSISTASGPWDLTSPIDLNISDYSDESDDEGYETVATPFRAHFSDRISPIQSPPPPPMTPSHGPSTNTAPTDIMPNDSHHELTSLIITSQINPFQQLALESRSPSLDMPQTDISPIDPCAYFAYESNRLDSFKKRNRETFARIKVGELAYAGFYLSAEGTIVRCPWCKVEITEEKFADILHRRPIIPGSPLNHEPWTAMRVHRHENGQLIDKDHPYCPWVRREPSGLYPNVIMDESRMHYPEYPLYSPIEKRIQSFASDWMYPSGTRLSNALMADAGYIYLSDDKVICYYCGNRLFKFKPLDCPFEEHAVNYPLCDYIIDKWGSSYIEQVLKESRRTPNARQKCEVTDGQTIKRIVFTDTGLTTRKKKRQAVLPIHSRLSKNSHRSNSHSTANNLDTIENNCRLCCENLPTYEYHPCQHSPMCGECSVKLTPKQREECIICLRPAKIAAIDMRVPMNHF